MLLSGTKTKIYCSVPLTPQGKRVRPSTMMTIDPLILTDQPQLPTTKLTARQALPTPARCHTHKSATTRAYLAQPWLGTTTQSKPVTRAVSLAVRQSSTPRALTPVRPARLVTTFLARPSQPAAVRRVLASVLPANCG